MLQNEMALLSLRSPRRCEPPGALLAEGTVQLPSPHEVHVVPPKKLTLERPHVDSTAGSIGEMTPTAR